MEDYTNYNVSKRLNSLYYIPSDEHKHGDKESLIIRSSTAIKSMASQSDTSTSKTQHYDDVVSINRLRQRRWIGGGGGGGRGNQPTCPLALLLSLLLFCHHINTTLGFYIGGITSNNSLYNNQCQYCSIGGKQQDLYSRQMNIIHSKRRNSSSSEFKATRGQGEISQQQSGKKSEQKSSAAKKENMKNSSHSNKISSSSTSTSTSSKTKVTAFTKNNKSQSTETTITTTNKNFTIPEMTLFRKEKQKRRKLKQPRRPSSFWADIHNIESELRSFWSSLNVPIASNEPPPIPNEALLNHFERHDLRYAIANMGGRDVISERLNGAKLIPGKWTQAVTTCKEVQYLLHPSNPAGRGLSEDVPPLAPYVMRTLKKQRLERKKKEMKAKQERLKKEQESVRNVLGMDTTSSSSSTAAATTTVNSTNNHSSSRTYKTYNDDDNVDHKLKHTLNENDDNMDIEDDEIVGHMHNLRFMGGQRWAHSSRRNPRGHWSQDVIIQELYQYLSHVKEEKGRPSVWMPRPSELAIEGRNDLKQAMVRFGGSAKTCTLAKLVPYRDWRYFESTLELYVELMKYLIKYHDGAENVFPKLADIQENRHERLYHLIMEYGGRKIIATRLDMEFQAQTKLDLFKGMSFGPFSLDFAVRLMYFIRNDMMEKEPPLEKALIQMPTRQYLLDKGEVDLAEEISMYGGHESIARRLHLAFDEDEAKREQKSLPQ